MPRSTARGLGTFYVVWIGQLLSVVGSNLTGFALGVWVYEQTGSVTHYALIYLFTTLPQIVIAPLAGALVDRWDRRHVMMLSDTGAGLSTLLMGGLLLTDHLSLGAIYLLVTVSSAFGAFQWPAYAAATTLLVPKQHYARASGMVDMGHGLGLLVAPALAGALLESSGLASVLLIDVSTFIIALLTLSIVRFPAPNAAQSTTDDGPLLRQLTFGWRYIMARPGLRWLLVFFASINFFNGFLMALVVPLFLSFTSSATLGTMISIGATGGLIGSVVLSVWGGPRTRIYGVLGFGAVFGLGIGLLGLTTSIVFNTLVMALIFFCLPIINGSSQAIWQSKVAPDVQGRVFAVRMMLVQAASPLAYLVAGALADQVFEPLLQHEGALAGSLGNLIGTGAGRGIGLMFVLMGLSIVLIVLASTANPRIRHVESDLADAISIDQAEDSPWTPVTT